MKILVLDATTKVLKADLAANPTTNPDYVISYADVDSSTFTEGSADGALTGTTSATLLTGLGSGSKRIVKSISIHNRDSNTITVYLKLDNNGTVRIIEKIVLAAGEAWHNDTQAGGGGTGRPSGSDTQVQFNDGGVFGGNAGLVFDKTTTTLTAANLVVSGGLTVNGTTTNINSTNLVVEDKNIVIGDVATPTDTTANGGGITLLGATNKTITWDSTNSNWTSSEHWNLASAKDFKINNVSVLNATTLGSSVTSSSLTSLGTLASLTVSGSASLATTSGSVGIGTSSPGAKLAVSDGTQRLQVTPGTGNVELRAKQESTNTDVQFIQRGSFFTWETSGTERARLDSSGNLGLGVTPSAWNSGYKAVVVGGTNSNNQVGGIASGSGITIVSTNYYRSATPSDLYAGTGYAMQYKQISGEHQWYTAPSGFGYGTAVTSLTSTQNGNSYTIVSAGTTDFTLIGAANNNVGTTFTKSGGTGTGTGTVSQPITFTQAMTLDASGNLGLGATSPVSNGSTFATLSLNGSNGSAQHFMSAGSTVMQLYNDANAFFLNASSGKSTIFQTAGTERARIDSSGVFTVGTTSKTTDTDIKLSTDNRTYGIRNDRAASRLDIVDFTASAVRASITSTGDLLPGANGTQNFGSSSLRWNTIYTSDLSLSNGIGDWTIVEGEDDLFIYNNKRNRVYKFKLEAVDPSTATPKREV